MSFSPETQDKMERFAREQARIHLENAELHHLAEIERARRQNAGMGDLSDRQLDDAQADLLEYMLDCMEGLVDQGCPEGEALDRVMASLAAEVDSPETQILREKYTGYFEDDGLTPQVLTHYEESIILGGVAFGTLLGLIFYWSGIIHNWVWATLGGMILGALFGVSVSSLFKGVILQRHNQGRNRGR